MSTSPFHRMGSALAGRVWAVAATLLIASALLRQPSAWHSRGGGACVFARATKPCGQEIATPVMRCHGLNGGVHSAQRRWLTSGRTVPACSIQRPRQQGDSIAVVCHSLSSSASWSVGRVLSSCGGARPLGRPPPSAWGVSSVVGACLAPRSNFMKSLNKWGVTLRETFDSRVHLFPTGPLSGCGGVGS